ncbi:caspase-6-like [Apostichopus japonicus]|uniref:caspase-6-like n=1 Tax=Stichopus japonicus TaxID=307972 RepID=UPI003AB379B1
MAEADISLYNMSHLDVGYKMQRRPRGLALIFNNERFHHLNERTGTQRDERELDTTFKKLGFVVKLCNDYTASEIRGTLLKASNFDHSNFDCFLCVFLTHGDDGIIYGSDGDPESFKGNGNVHSTNRTWLRLNDDVFDIFRGNNCDKLIGKPKIFIIQACRGGKAEIPATEIRAPTKYSEIAEGVNVTIPTEADFLICYSSSEGYYSIRELFAGTWFIQDLNRVLNEFGNNADFIQLLTVVNRLVSERTVRGFGKLEEIKQMPCFLSKLTKQLRFDDQQPEADSPKAEKKGCCNRCRCC